MIDELLDSGLVQRCLAADGGLPIVAERSFLVRRWAGPQTVTTAVRDDAGRLIAAGAVRPGPFSTDPVVTRPIFTGLVDPAARGQGVGGRLLDWGLAEAASRDGPVTVETEGLAGAASRGGPVTVETEGLAGAASPGGPVTVETEGLTPAAAELFASRGLRRVFGEHVMRIDLAGPVATPVWPAGTTLETWCDATVPRFFAVYEAAFGDRPGFPGWSMPQWADDDVRPEWSVLATVPGLGDAGFVTGDDGWLNQVGVLPAARGKGLGAALVGEFLTRMRAGGGTEAWLNVGVDNPAHRLYQRLGFADRGIRARYESP